MIDRILSLKNLLVFHTDVAFDNEVIISVISRWRSDCGYEVGSAIDGSSHQNSAFSFSPFIDGEMASATAECAPLNRRNSRRMLVMEAKVKK
jgi:hypothetical protein